MTPIFDTHAHYDDSAFDEDRYSLLTSMPENGVAKIVNVAAEYESSKRCIELADKYDFVYFSTGVHPENCGDMTPEWLNAIEKYAAHPKCVAIGEIGLDYYWPEPDREIQKRWFKEQVELARKVRLPIIIHSRDAAKDTADILADAHAEEIGGVIHCYSYSPEVADFYLGMDFYFGIGGVVTFKNGKKLKETVEKIPLSNIVLETDSPYLSPEPNRGKRNNSTNIAYVIKAISEIKGVSEEEVRRVTWENAHDLYRLNL